jgi:hypothetical protein
MTTLVASHQPYVVTHFYSTALLPLFWNEKNDITNNKETTFQLAADEIESPDGLVRINILLIIFCPIRVEHFLARF